MRTTLILVTGIPATGKTTIARRLASDLKVPLIVRDSLKELLLDQLGCGDRAWSKRLGIASWHLMYMMAASLVAAGGSLILESYFQDEFDARKIDELRTAHDLTVTQVWCHARPDVVLARFEARIQDGRHSGHADREFVEELRAHLADTVQAALRVEGTVYEVDTTDFGLVKVDGLVRLVAAELGQ